MPSAGSAPSAGDETGALLGALPPALQSDDASPFAAVLSDTRERAAQIADDLDRLGRASDGLARVQRFVGRLRDVAVVALDTALQPDQRAMLQRQVDLTLSEIDTVANSTQIDEGLVRGGTPTTPTAGADSPQPTSFRAIGTAVLGLTDLGVRSPDQAMVATGALDLATSRLQRSGRALGSATNRLQDALNRLTNPSTTVSGEPALDGETAAFGSAMLLRGQLIVHQSQAVQAQAGLDVPRVRWLLDGPPR